MTNLTVIKSQTNATYDRVATQWDTSRNKDLHERPWIDRLLAGLPTPARVLDLGCGSARPIGQYIANLRHLLTGVDASPAMIALARTHVPEATFLEMDLTNLTLTGTFDAVLSWDGTFHLSVAEQRALLPRLAALTAPGGNLLLTIGHSEGEVTGTVAGETVYHASLHPDEYIFTLTRLGFETVTHAADDPTTYGHHILLATNRTAAQ
ncbi:Trans-aconitate 2-methyltransferase [Shimia sp. SK013]|uniref:class I SAM-dependent methyltransferase n=1 Tax=Shimia sp. SK013 TaxID=1389006 RepID=UPI0006B66CA8|nr:class I SAM-dependent methyltransferase [Shimia sp. SK013]KPA20867.1 Trans-aconitate 2-methyltransferase [Shimia sp. SK013]